MIVRRPFVIRCLSFILLCAGFSFAFTNFQQRARIHLIGDSTIANKKPEVYPETGWGMIFPQFIDADVFNHAVNGRSTKSFRTLGHWDNVLKELRAGDWVFIQFGHNDSKESDTLRYAPAQTSYRENLKKYIAEIRERKAHPLLITPVMRRKFDKQGVFVDQHGDYPRVVKEVGKELDVPVLDLHAHSKVLIEAHGVEGSRKLFLNLKPGESPNYPEGKDDNTHFTEYGARLVAALVADALRGLNIPLSGLVNNSYKQKAVDALDLKNYPKSVRVEVSNSLVKARNDAFVFVPLTAIKKVAGDFNENAIVVLDNDVEIASQLIQQNGQSGIAIVVRELPSKTTRVLTIRYMPTGKVMRYYPKLTQAELAHKTGGRFVNREYIGGEFTNVDYLRVPPEHKDHSWFIRYEGPGWESDKVGYRFYLDQRNATDVFGKLTPEPVLQYAGLDGFDSYHKMQWWGMDVMKVGKSLGVGSIGSLVNNAAVRVEKTDSVSCRIVENGNLYSEINTQYHGWQVAGNKYALESTLSIHAGSRVSRQQLSIKGDIANICTGIGKDKQSAVLIEKGNKNKFAYVATYGKQSLNNDNLGLAVLFPADRVIEFTTDDFSHIVSLKPVNGNVEYYFLAAWELERDGIKDRDSFIRYIETLAGELASPLKITVKKSI